MDEFDSLDGIQLPPPDAWPKAKRQFPIGASATGRVLGRQPFGVFLDLGQNAIGLIEMPALPQVDGSNQVAYPEVGAAVTGVVVRHRESNHQIELVSENPMSDLFRQRRDWALNHRSEER